MGRTLWRVIRVGFALARAALFIVLTRPAPGVALHRLCRQLTQILGIEITVTGAIPLKGLIVSNHLGYVDILVLSAVAPVSFVSKKEVRAWPVFGWFAQRTWTIFVDRSRRQGVADSVSEIGSALEAGRLVVLFPEGTSSGGDSVLPFRSSLFAAADAAVPSGLAYGLEPGDGMASERVCYWKDHTMGPHLLGLLGCRRILAQVVLRDLVRFAGDRKVFAQAVYEEVEAAHRIAREKVAG